MRESRWCRVLAWLAAGCILSATWTVFGQCPGGVCPAQRPQLREPAVYVPGPQTPRPAWRYEQAAGHRAAVVWIKTQDRGGRQSIGSGVLVRWGKRVVVLSARHVVADAAKIWVRLRSGRWCEGRVLKADGTWDAVVLEIGQAADAEPAELEFGEAAHPRPGDRLESCGCGPDGRLAVNSGHFLRYSTASQGGPADWMVLSGRARGGDSGGPIFNQRGRVVGVLWGTDGSEVIGAQAGRLHVLLQSACGPLTTTAGEKVAATPRATSPAEQVSGTAPEPADQDVLETSLGGGQPRCLPLLRPRPEQHPTPVPQIIVQSDVEARGTLQRIDGKLDQIVRNTAPPPPAVGDDRNRFHPLVAGLIIVAAVVLGFVAYFASQKG